MNKKVELLAPAGGYETMVAAFNAGADAVYLGGSKFGARAYADNFDTEQVLDAIRYAHLHDKRIYMTVNTLVKEREFSQVYDFMVPFANEKQTRRRSIRQRRLRRIRLRLIRPRRRRTRKTQRRSILRRGELL